jgi:hypothetical protein
MAENSVTNVIAIYGAFVASIGGIWNIYQWWSRGPKLVGRYSPGMVMFEPGASVQSTEKYLSITISNQGTSPTTLTSLGLFGYDTLLKYYFRRPSFTAIIPKQIGAQLPTSLAVGSEWKALCVQDEKIEELSRSKLLCFVVSHSFSSSETRIKIRPIPFKT